MRFKKGLKYVLKTGLLNYTRFIQMYNAAKKTANMLARAQK